MPDPKEILRTKKTYALVGATQDMLKYSYELLFTLLDAGYTVYRSIPATRTSRSTGVIRRCPSFHRSRKWSSSRWRRRMLGDGRVRRGAGNLHCVVATWLMVGRGNCQRRSCWSRSPVQCLSDRHTAQDEEGGIIVRGGVRLQHLIRLLPQKFLVSDVFD